MQDPIPQEDTLITVNAPPPLFSVDRVRVTVRLSMPVAVKGFRDPAWKSVEAGAEASVPPEHAGRWTEALQTLYDRAATEVKTAWGRRVRLEAPKDTTDQPPADLQAPTVES